MGTSRKRKPKSAFAQIDANRKRYDPALDGYGNAEQWRQSFSQRIGFEEAQRILRDEEQDARELLGVPLSATWSDITKAFRRKALACHPDRAILTGMQTEDATEAFKRIKAAYSVVAHEYGK